jgi:hypothetical protein
VEPLVRAKHKPSAFVAGHFWQAAPGSFFVSAEVLAGSYMDGGNPEMLLQSIARYYKFLPGPQQEAFPTEIIGLLREEEWKQQGRPTKTRSQGIP